MKKILRYTLFNDSPRSEARFFDLCIVFAIMLPVLGCGVSSSVSRNRRDNRNGSMRSTPTPARTAQTPTQAATALPPAADSPLTTALVTQTARFMQAVNTADNATLASLMADNFQHYARAVSRSISQREYLEMMEDQSDFVSVTVKNARLIENDGPAAVIEYLLIEEYNKRTERTNCQSYFVKSDAAWLIQNYVYSETVTTAK